MRQATVRDILDLRRGRHWVGALVHQDCGHRIVWSLMIDGARCAGCGIRWDYGWLLDREQAMGKAGLYQWQPPVEQHDEFTDFR